MPYASADARREHKPPISGYSASQTAKTQSAQRRTTRTHTNQPRSRTVSGTGYSTRRTPLDLQPYSLRPYSRTVSDTPRNQHKEKTESWAVGNPRALSASPTSIGRARSPRRGIGPQLRGEGHAPHTLALAHRMQRRGDRGDRGRVRQRKAPRRGPGSACHRPRPKPPSRR